MCGGLAAGEGRAVPGALVAASPLDCVSDWLHLGSFLSGLSVSGGTRRILAGSARDSTYANKGLPAATAARAVATTVITQFSFRVAFISYLGLLVISLWFQFRKRLSPVSRQKIAVLAIRQNPNSPLPPLRAPGHPQSRVQFRTSDFSFSLVVSVSQRGLAGFSPSIPSHVVIGAWWPDQACGRATRMAG